MADSKDKKTPHIVRSVGRQPAEASPNPHGEGKVIQMPIRTDQKRETGKQNIARTPNTLEGRLNPSVAHEFQPRAGVQQDRPAEPRRQRKPVRQNTPPKENAGEKEA